MAVTPELNTIRAAARRAQARMRLARVVGILPIALLLGLGASAVVLAVRKAFPERLPEATARGLLIGAGLSLALAVTVALLQRLRPFSGALALDRHHALHGRLTNAIELGSKSEGVRTPFEAAAIEDGCKHAKGLSPRAAVPIRLPPRAGIVALVGLAVAGLAVLEVELPSLAPELLPLSSFDALEMPPDDLDLLRQEIAALKREDRGPEVQAAIDRFNALVEDIANRRLNRSEAFRRMEEIDRDLMAGLEAESQTLKDAIKSTADALKESKLTEPVGKSLEEQKLDESQKDLKQLAEKLRHPNQKPDAKEIEKLRKALEEAQARKKEALDAINEKRAELRKDLLKKKKPETTPDGGAPDQKEQDLLRNKERELQRLDRESERQERAQRSLSKLDRDLAKAAEDLMRDLGMSAKDLEQAAEDINRLEQEQQMSEKEKEELRQRLEELRELIRQQGQGGQKRMARLLRFGQRARGKQGQGGEQQPGGEGKEQGEGKMRPGGESPEGEDGKMLVLGPGGKPVPMPGGQGDTPGQSGGQEGHDQGGQPGEPGGKGIGKDPGADPKGKTATDPKMSTQDVEAQGLDNKQGPTNSEVIMAAADRGFQGRPYQKVYREYQTKAEDQINKEDIPDGFRFYVRRYFQLIRPRE